MSKSLSHILTIFKIARILAKIVFIACIVGVVGCLIGLSTLPVVNTLLPEMLLAQAGLDFASLYLSCVVGALTCVGEGVFAFFAEKYFKNVLAAQSPFTREGSKECLRLGLIAIIASLAIAVAAGFAELIFLFLLPATADWEFSTSVSLTTGLFFLFLSLIFKHGGELREDLINLSASAAEPSEEPEQTAAEASAEEPEEKIAVDSKEESPTL